MKYLDKATHILQEEGLLELLSRFLFFFMRRVDYTIMALLPSSFLYYYLEFRSRVFPTTSDANPIKPIWVDPDDIEYFHGPQAFGKNEFGYVATGNWDTPECLFEETDRFIHIKETIESVCTDNTGETNPDLMNTKRHWGTNSNEDIVDLYQKIKMDGYKSQQELLVQESNLGQNRCNDAPHPLLNEIGVYIYRDGTIVKNGGGHHRLSIAKLLDINQVPATVRVRHEEWQDIRNEMKQAESACELPPRTREYIGHPDLISVAPSS